MKSYSLQSVELSVELWNKDLRYYWIHQDPFYKFWMKTEIISTDKINFYNHLLFKIRMIYNLTMNFWHKTFKGLQMLVKTSKIWKFLLPLAGAFGGRWVWSQLRWKLGEGWDWFFLEGACPVAEWPSPHFLLGNCRRPELSWETQRETPEIEQSNIF